MTLVDTNILIYSTFEHAPEHDRSRGWMQAQLKATDSGLVLAWPVLYAFVRLISSTRVFGAAAVPVADAWSHAQSLIRQPNARIVTSGPGHARIAGELAATGGLRSDDVPDIEIAALAIEHGVALATHDSGFRRFAGLRVVDPLEG